VNANLPVVNVGTRERPVYLPADVCEVEAGQPVKNKLSPRQTQNMLNFAVKGRMPAQNAQSIASKGVGVLGIGQPLNATLVSERSALFFSLPHFLTSATATSRMFPSLADHPHFLSFF
jgi:hypothetical protein